MKQEREGRRIKERLKRPTEQIRRKNRRNSIKT